MNSFRIVDTKFRILKGGKIGLSLSISLIGGMLVFSSVNADATDYFTDVESTLGTSTNISGSFDIIVETAVNSGTLSSTRTESSNDDIIFKPTSWATTSYSSAYFVNDVDNDIPLNGIDYSQYTIISESASLPQLTLTFDSSANAANISKNSLLNKYDTAASGTVDINSNTTYNLNSASSSLYPANIIFTGSNIISGTTNIDDGNIQISGNVTFEKDLTATTTNVGTGTGNFNTISGTTTSNIVFTSDGTANLNNGLIGNVTSNSDNQGTLTFIGSTSGNAQSISGNIGSSSTTDLNI